MTMSDKEVRLIPRGQADSTPRAPEPSHDVFADVRSTVESQFRQMEQAHARIRAQELAVRLAEQMTD